MEHEFESSAGPDPATQGRDGDADQVDSPAEPRTFPDAGDDVSRIDIDDPAFGIRLARLLVHRRESIGVGLGAMARRSNRTVPRTTLRELESGTSTLDPALVSRVVALYGVDLDDIAPARIRIRIDRSARTVSAGGVAAHFGETDADELLRTYLRLVRRLRDQQDVEVISLRRDDVDDLARFLGRPAESVLERLCDLMGSTRSQRRMVVGMCLAGAMMVTIAVPSAAALRGDGSPSTTVIDPGLTDLSMADPAMADPAIADPAMARPWTPDARGRSGAPIVDPMVDPFRPAHESSEVEQGRWPLVIVDIDGIWDRERVLDSEGRLRPVGSGTDDRPDRDRGDSTGDSPGEDGDDTPDDVDLWTTGSLEEVQVLPPGGTGATDFGDGSDEPIWIPPFPDRIVDPGIAPSD